MEYVKCVSALNLASGWKTTDPFVLFLKYQGTARTVQPLMFGVALLGI